MRQGCVLNPTVFCAVVGVAISALRAKLETEGLNLHDGMQVFLGLTFAKGVLVFASSRDGIE